MTKKKVVLEQIMPEALDIRTVRRLLGEAEAAGAISEPRSEHISSIKTRRQAKMGIRGVTVGSNRIYIRYVVGDSVIKAAMIYTDGKKRYVRIHFDGRNHDILLD